MDEGSLNLILVIEIERARYVKLPFRHTPA